MKKIFLSLILAMLALALISCSGDKESGDSDTGSDTAVETPPVEEVLELVNKTEGTTATIVYAVAAQPYELDAVQTVSEQFYRLTDVRIRPSAEEPTYNADTVEIIVGRTSHQESIDVYKTLGYGEGKVAVVGNKVVIAGYNEAALTGALDQLITALFNRKTDDGVFTIQKDFSAAFQDNPMLAQIPYSESFTAGKLTNTGDNCYMLTFDSVSLQALSDYVAIFGNKGYELYTENTIDDNKFYTYTNEEYVLNVIYTGYNNSVHVLVQSLEDTALPTRAEDNVYTPIEGCETTISQLGLYYPFGDNGAEKYFNGMSYVMRLADGSFIVIDGGHNKSIDGDRIYNVMRKQAPDPDNIVVAAWIFTHAHSDHIGFFNDFAKNYSDKVTVEQFIYNFPGAEQRGTLADNRDMVDGAMAKYFKNVPKVKAHAGQEYYIRNAKITMLYSLDVYRSELTDYNNTSLAFTIEAEGYKWMVFGDYSEGGQTLRSMYSAKTLKSDIMQVSHHGVAGQSTQTYEIVAPEYALWPAGDYFVSFVYNGAVQNIQLKEQSWNKYMMEKMDQSKVFWAKDDIVILTLGADGITSQTFETDTAYLNG